MSWRRSPRSLHSCSACACKGERKEGGYFVSLECAKERRGRRRERCGEGERRERRGGSGTHFGRERSEGRPNAPLTRERPFSIPPSSASRCARSSGGNSSNVRSSLALLEEVFSGGFVLLLFEGGGCAAPPCWPPPLLLFAEFCCRLPKLSELPLDLDGCLLLPSLLPFFLLFVLGLRGGWPNPAVTQGGGGCIPGAIPGTKPYGPGGGGGPPWWGGK